MNFGTKLRTVLVIATSLHTALMATDLTGFSNATVDMIYKVVTICLNFVIVAIAAYYNNDFTETACRYTGAMRLEKERQNGIVTGEDFWDEPDEDDEEEEIEDPDEEDPADMEEGEEA